MSNDGDFRAIAMSASYAFVARAARSEPDAENSAAHNHRCAANSGRTSRNGPSGVLQLVCVGEDRFFFRTVRHPFPFVARMKCINERHGNMSRARVGGARGKAAFLVEVTTVAHLRNAAGVFR